MGLKTWVDTCPTCMGSGSLPRLGVAGCLCDCHLYPSVTDGSCCEEEHACPECRGIGTVTMEETPPCRCWERCRC